MPVPIHFPQNVIVSRGVFGANFKKKINSHHCACCHRYQPQSLPTLTARHRSCIEKISTSATTATTTLLLTADDASIAPRRPPLPPAMPSTRPLRAGPHGPHFFHCPVSTMVRRQEYSPDTLREAVNRACTGESQTEVSKSMRIPLRTLSKYAALRKNAIVPAPARRGPPPLLISEGEARLVEWVKGMQLNGTPATRMDILARAGEMTSLLAGTALSVSDGWYFCFMKRHPDLANRCAQTIARSRNECSSDRLSVLFYNLVKVLVDGKYDASRVFNMDGTSFMNRSKNSKVVAVRGSHNVWSTGISSSFHLSVVACGSADGYVVSPLFILPGQRVSRNLMAGCSVPGARVTCTDSGFISRSVFLKWVEMFSNSVPESVPRPLLLLFDSYLSHLSLDLIGSGERLGIQFVCLPANATHLIQPLDIAVFSAFKKSIRAMVRCLMLRGFQSVSKESAVAVASAAWTQSLLGKNCVAGFRTTGLFPPSLPNMTKKLQLFKSGGAKKGVSKAAWLVYQPAVKSETLTLPAQVKATEKKRKTVDVTGRLLTREQLLDMCPPAKRSRQQSVQLGEDGSAVV